MKVTKLGLLSAVAACLISGSLAIRCYQCSYDEDTGFGENECKDNGEDIVDSLAKACDQEFDLCTFTYIGEESRLCLTVIMIYK